MRYSAYITIALVLPGLACSGSSDAGHSGESKGSTTSPTTAAVVQVVTRTDIVSDIGNPIATDPTLVNAWGLSFNPTGVAWVSANGSGLAEVYDSMGGHVIPSVVIPACRADVSSPTGNVFNATPDAFMGDRFIFVTEQGTIAGWQPSLDSQAALRVGASDCSAMVSADVYKGVTIATDAWGKEPRLYAANFRVGTVDVFDSTYTKVQVTGGFVDPALPDGFAPFNVQELDGRIVVTYAKQNDEKMDDVKGVGNGFVDLFDVDGNLITRLISGDVLNSPWGIVMTPSNFGTLPSRLLVGNFGDGLIHVYSPIPPASSGTEVMPLQLEGTLGTDSGTPLVVDGLWALRFGPGTGGFLSNVLYFTAGPDDEMHGVFGKLDALGTMDASCDP